MTDKIIISRKEIEALLDGIIGWYEDDLRALLDKAEVVDDLSRLLDKAEVSEPIGEMKENGVTWFKQNPHAYPVGTKFYTTPQPSRIAELEAEIARLKNHRPKDYK